MPESWDKHGPPKLWAKICCLVPGCGGERLLFPEDAERLARRIERGLSLRYLIGRYRCQKCRHRNASITFHLAYPGKRPWDKPVMPWRNEGERAAYYRASKGR
ncbi:hypothetical protein A8950_3496 [Dongia mobilis]|uniref:Uncharacterized protein n=1 Tax=Dongia mobilis TaxID=578943 RepID=A0A4R6WJ28_9PROT|nr:hypothetical protein [Dongia mobilis]TDQ78444.1 hypothetical protein A8950_3496 [Dongia mobilis]